MQLSAVWFFCGIVVASWIWLAIVFVIATVLSAAFSSPGNKGHLEPKISPVASNILFILCFLVFPFLVMATGARLHDHEQIDVILINGFATLVAWHIVEKRKGDRKTPSE